MEDQLVNKLTPWIPVISAFGGALITGLTAFGLNWTNKKTEERKHKQQLIIKAAIANWNRDFDILKEHQKAGYDVKITPLDIYLVHQTKLIDVILDKEITKKDLFKKLQDVEDITSLTLEWYKNTDRNKEKTT